jgi:hypothetical protein
MSTRAIYTFKDPSYIIHVYKHHDGYPEGAAEALVAAKKAAWEGSRYEADEFAAAFVAANKTSSCGIRLIGMDAKGTAIAPEGFATDTEYLYEITGPDTVEAWEADGDGKRAKKSFFKGSFADLAEK